MTLRDASKRRARQNVQYQGAQARINRVNINDVPYRRGTEPFTWWLEGYNAELEREREEDARNDDTADEETGDEA